MTTTYIFEVRKKNETDEIVVCDYEAAKQVGKSIQAMGCRCASLGHCFRLCGETVWQAVFFMA